MELIYTDKHGVEQGVLRAYTLDLSFGVSENNFELTVNKTESMLEDGAILHIEGTEYGGIVGGMKSDSAIETRTSIGRTWHGILDSKVLEPDLGDAYLVISGDSITVLSFLFARMGLSTLFVASKEHGSVQISPYQFARYCKGYAGIRAMLKANKAKLKMFLLKSHFLKNILKRLLKIKTKNNTKRYGIFHIFFI